MGGQTLHELRAALAEAEVEYKDKQSPAIDVAYAAVDQAAVRGLFGGAEVEIAIPIWTTTPWTLPANQAVALNPGLEYAVVACDGPRGPERLLVAEAMLKDVMHRYAIERYRVVEP